MCVINQRNVLTIGPLETMISKSRFYNMFDYFGCKRQVGDRPVVGKLCCGIRNTVVLIYPLND